MIVSLKAHDPSARFADTSPTSLGRKTLSDFMIIAVVEPAKVPAAQAFNGGERK